MSDLFLQLGLQVLLIIFNAIFACAEIAILSTNEVKISKLAQEGDKRAKRLEKLKNKPAKFLSTIQIAITLSGFLGSAFAASNFSERIVSALAGAGISFAGIETVTVIVITFVLSFITIVFGELVPKRVAMKYAEKLALSMSGMLTVIAFISAPFVWLLSITTNGVLRLLRIDPNDPDEEVSEEEIRLMVDVGSEKGVIDVQEKEMIQNVFEFDDLTVGEFATHRTDIVILWLDEDNEKWKQTIHETRHSIYPVCGESADDLVGVLNAKDFFRLYGQPRDVIMSEAVTDAYFVPESVKADTLFKQMKKTGNRFAVVLDEYGGVFGIVTMNDIIEQIVGGFDIETIEEERDEIVDLGEDKWRVKGSAGIDDVAERINVPIECDDEYDTFGGLVFGLYGSVPADGSTFEIDVNDFIHVSVEKIAEHRIESAVVTVTRPVAEGEEKGDSDKEEPSRKDKREKPEGQEQGTQPEKIDKTAAAREA